MPLPFDATLKDLVQNHPHDWEVKLGLRGPEPVTVLNVDLSTISAATDVALGFGDPLQWLVDLNFQASRAADLADRILLYNALLRYRYHVPVHSLVLLLRSAADDPNQTGKVRYQVRPRRGKMDFGFEVVRLWRWPVKRILTGGVGTLPLAPLCQMPGGVSLEEGLPGVIHYVAERLSRETTPDQTAKLLTATYVLTGLRVSRDVIR
jgi:hypothetical protein